MKYRSFEEVPVWRDAMELAVLIFELTSQSPFKGYYSVKDQWSEREFQSQTILRRVLSEGRRKRR